MAMGYMTDNVEATKAMMDKIISEEGEEMPRKIIELLNRDLHQVVVIYPHGLKVEAKIGDDMTYINVSKVDETLAEIIRADLERHNAELLKKIESAAYLERLPELIKKYEPMLERLAEMELPVSFESDGKSKKVSVDRDVLEVLLSHVDYADAGKTKVHRATHLADVALEGRECDCGWCVPADGRKEG